MRPIGTLPSHDDATRFGDYLLAIGLRNHIEETRDGSGYLVWIEHDDHVEQGQLQLRQFQANPNDPKYDEAGAAAKAARKQEERAAERRRRNYTDVRTSWAGAKIRPTPVSSILIVICVVVAGLTLLGMSDKAAPARVIDALVFQSLEAGYQSIEANEGARRLSTMFSSITSGQVWRLFTPMFVHFSPLHLLFNLSWILAIGRMIEIRKGAWFLLGLVLGSALLSNCAEAIWSVYFGPRDMFGFTRFGGFSGVNYALFGYAWMKGRYQPYELIGVGPQTVGLMLTWLVLCMLGILGPIANAAHVAGLVVGVAVGAWPTLMRRAKTRR